jgi:hypothetical protein
LAVLASQHNPNALIRQSKEKFEAPDLLLTSMQKPVAPQAAMQISKTDGSEPADFEEDYGEKYDDTCTFTVKDFKEQALRYAKNHFSQSSNGAQTTMVLMVDTSAAAHPMSTFPQTMATCSTRTSHTDMPHFIDQLYFNYLH